MRAKIASRILKPKLRAQLSCETSDALLILIGADGQRRGKVRVPLLVRPRDHPLEAYLVTAHAATRFIRGVTCRFLPVAWLVRKLNGRESLRVRVLEAGVAPALILICGTNVWIVVNRRDVIELLLEDS